MVRALRLDSVLLAVALAAVIGWPLAATVVESVRGTAGPTGGSILGPLGLDTGVPRPIGLAVNTVKLVGLTELLALPVGVGLALVLVRTDAWGRRALLGLVALVLFVPLPLHATAWLGAIGNAGRAQAFGSGPILVGLGGAAFVHAMAAIPWVVLVAGVGLRAVERPLEESALLDMPGWRVALTVTLRRSLGAIAAAALAVAVLTAGDMTVTDLLQVRTYAEEVYIQSQLGDGPAAAAKVALPPTLALAALLLLLGRGLVRLDPARIAAVDRRPKVWRLGAWRVPLGVLASSTLGVMLFVPVYGLLWRAGRVAGASAAGRAPHWSLAGLLGTLRGAFDEVALPSYLMPSPLVSSLLWSALGATAAVAVAWALAWKGRGPGPWRWAAAGCVALTLAAPGPIAGMSLVLAYRDLFVVGGRPLLYDSPAILVLAFVQRTLPFAVLILWPALRAIPPEFLDGAAVDGYGPWGRVRRVALPLSRRAIATAWGVAFVMAMGELPATNIVRPPGATTVSYLVWSLLHTGVESHLAGVGLILVLLFAAAGFVAARPLERLLR